MPKCINFNAKSQGLHDLTHPAVTSQKLIYVFPLKRNIFPFIPDPFLFSLTPLD